MMNKHELAISQINIFWYSITMIVHSVISFNFFYMWYCISSTIEILSFVRWFCFIVGIIFILLALRSVINILQEREKLHG